MTCLDSWNLTLKNIMKSGVKELPCPTYEVNFVGDEWLPVLSHKFHTSGKIQGLIGAVPHVTLFGNIQEGTGKYLGDRTLNNQRQQKKPVRWN